jgi:hypothetical protein
VERISLTPVMASICRCGRQAVRRGNVMPKHRLRRQLVT